MYLYMTVRKSRPLIGVVTVVVGIVADLTGNIQYAFLLWAALPVPAGVDVERGRADARAWSSYGNEEHVVEGDTVANLDG
jgi:MFS transporter, UMF1 family